MRFFFQNKGAFASLFFTLIFFATICFANTDNSLFPSKTVYFGVNLGGGTTEWKYLVDTADRDGQTDMSTPTSVSEGGVTYGFALGYDVATNFAIEFQYMIFPNATVNFSPYSSYMYADGDNVLSMITKTDAFSLSGKFFVRFGKTHFRAFSAVGAGVVIRRDILVNYDDESPQYADNPPPYSNVTGQDKKASCVSPFVAAGLDYNFTRHWIAETGFQYYTGFGASQLTPVSSFIPFAWDVYGRLAYQL